MWPCSLLMLKYNNAFLSGFWQEFWYLLQGFYCDLRVLLLIRLSKAPLYFERLSTKPEKKHFSCKTWCIYIGKYSFFFINLCWSTHNLEDSLFCFLEDATNTNIFHSTLSSLSHFFIASSKLCLLFQIESKQEIQENTVSCIPATVLISVSQSKKGTIRCLWKRIKGSIQIDQTLVAEKANIFWNFISWSF